MSDDTLQGRFVWYELLTSDPDAATDFYTELIGWGTAEWGEGENPYVMWTTDETPEGSMGGVIPLTEEAKKAGAPPHWLPYVGASDIEATVSEAQKLGGKVIVPLTEIPTVGRFAVLSDPQGAGFAVFAPAEQAPGHEGPALLRSSPGMNWQPQTTRPLLSSMMRCLVGRKPKVWTWGPREFTRCMGERT